MVKSQLQSLYMGVFVFLQVFVSCIHNKYGYIVQCYSLHFIMILTIYTVVFIFVFLLLLSSDFKKKKHFNKKIKVTVCFLLWFQFSFSRGQYSITGMKNKVTQWWLIPEVSYLTHNNNNNANNTSPLFCLSHTALYNQN